jgi:ppGpp synthetase/RelA/SpoT-type nucleotidyltranferase
LSDFSDDIVDWYIQNRPKYDEFVNKLENLITEILAATEINYHSIQARTKTIDSFKSKLAKGVSYDPKKMNDLIGLRIIAYVKSDVEKITQCIIENFVAEMVRDSEMEDSLEINKVGYRSKHFVCELQSSRQNLVEYERFSGIRFEIQVRTILEHAWAEINHDRNYKFPGTLPQEIRRSFYLLAGALEIIDNEFERICNDVDSYSNSITSNKKDMELNVPIDVTSLSNYLKNKMTNEKIKPSFGQSDIYGDVIQELNIMGINFLKDLDKMISNDFIKKYLGILENLKYNQTTYATLLRVLMILKDPEGYFTKALNKQYVVTNRLVNIMNLLGLDITKIKSFPGYTNS